MGKKKGSSTLPYDYQVEYLMTDGHQYINTDIKPDWYTGICVKVTAGKQNYLGETDNFIVGCRNNTGNTRWALCKSGSSALTYYYGYGTYDNIEKSINWKGSVTRELKLNYLDTRKAWSGTNSRRLPSLSFTPAYNIRLFGSSGVDANYTKFGGKIHWCKISQRKDIVRDFIPVVKNGVGCMYDKITKQFYYNSGTGSFTIGPQIN